LWLDIRQLSIAFLNLHHESVDSVFVTWQASFVRLQGAFD
jgi:hypothetical protein